MNLEQWDAQKVLNPEGECKNLQIQNCVDLGYKWEWWEPEKNIGIQWCDPQQVLSVEWCEPQTTRFFEFFLRGGKLGNYDFGVVGTIAICKC